MWVSIVVALTTTGYVLIMLPVLIFLFFKPTITIKTPMTSDMLYYIPIKELLAIRSYILPVIKDSGRDSRFLKPIINFLSIRFAV